MDHHAHHGHAHAAPPDPRAERAGAEHEGHGSQDGHGSHAGHDAPAHLPTHPPRGAHDGHDAHGGHGPHSGGGGHDKHAGHSVAMFRDRFWLSLALTVPTLVWGHMLPSALGYAPPAVPGAHWIPAVFGTAVFLYGGLVFLRGAAGELRARLPGMMTLISLALVVAFGFSVAVALGFPGMPLWEELATLTTVMVLGHWIEMRSIDRASGALRELARLLPSVATRIVGEGTETVEIAALRPGDVVLVRPGEAVPADGVVREGTSDLDESALTGESRPVRRAPGDPVVAGTVNGAAALRVEVTRTGEETALAGIMRMVESAQASRSRAQALADRAARLLTIVALAAGAVTLVAWLVAGASAAYAIERTVAVLVVACPHALGLAVPLVVALSTTMGARAGLLVRDRRGLEEARRVATVVFDKTGTLTRGTFGVVDLVADAGVDADDALARAAALETDSEHPIARGIVRTAAERGLPLPRATGFTALPGRGAEATVDGTRLRIGGPALLRESGLSPAPALAAAAERAADRGEAAVWLMDDERVLAVLAVADVVRPESAEAVRALRDRGVRVAMLTGDARPVAEAVGRALGIDEVMAEVLPGEKAARIEALRARGPVLMVGDGVNDAPALVTADVGVAIGAGTDVAVEAGDVVLVRSDPRDVPRILALSRATYRKMVQNLWWAAGYNIVAIPLAAGAAAPWGFVLHPALAALLMSASTVVVALNAQLLRRTRL